jgi:hypothetical protein
VVIVGARVRLASHKVLVAVSPFWSVFLGYVCISSLLYWPALTQMWRLYDDYYLSDLLHRGRFNELVALILRNGRPAQLVFHALFWLDGGTNQALMNMTLRFLQGTLHALTATLIAFLLFKVTRRLTAFLVILPFLLWPFRGEAVLWRAAIEYPVAALFSVTGLWIIRQHSDRWSSAAWGGAFLIAVSVLVNQSSAFAALAAWMLILLAITLYQFEVPPARLVREGILLACAYLMGTVATFIVTGLVSSSRARVATDLLAKLNLYLRMNQLVLFWPDYPQWLWAAQGLILLAAGGALLVGLIRRTYHWRQVLLVLALVFASTIVPYTANLIVALNWPSWRALYLGPLLIVALCLVADHAWSPYRVVRAIPFALLGILIAGYGYVSFLNAGDYPLLYHRDLQVMKQAEDFAAQDNVRATEVYVATLGDGLQVSTWNPYDLHYIHADGKEPALFYYWAADGLMREYSWLRPVRDRTSALQCRAKCAIPRQPGKEFRLFKLDAAPVICLCPP